MPWEQAINVDDLPPELPPPQRIQDVAPIPPVQTPIGADFTTKIEGGPHQPSNTKPGRGSKSQSVTLRQGIGVAFILVAAAVLLSVMLSAWDKSGGSWFTTILRGEAMTDAEVLEFKDHPAAYRGKMLTMMLTYNGHQVLDLAKSFGANARSKGHFDCPFEATRQHYPGTYYDFNIILSVPLNSQDLPRLSHGEQVLAIFVCQNGDLSHGNIVQTIARP